MPLVIRLTNGKYQKLNPCFGWQMMSICYGIYRLLHIYKGAWKETLKYSALTIIVRNRGICRGISLLRVEEKGERHARWEDEAGSSSHFEWSGIRERVSALRNILYTIYSPRIWGIRNNGLDQCIDYGE